MTKKTLSILLFLLMFVLACAGFQSRRDQYFAQPFELSPAMIAALSPYAPVIQQPQPEIQPEIAYVISYYHDFFEELPAQIEMVLQPINPAHDTTFQWRNLGFALPEREKLTFSVQWRFLTVGTATLEIRGFEYMHGRRAYHIYSSARSAPFFDRIFRVRNTSQSWIDAESISSLRFWSQISEGGEETEERIDFNQIDNFFLLYYNGAKSKGVTVPWVQDVLSALYYLRTKDFQVGSEIVIDAHSGYRTWPLTINVIRRETVRVPAGTFETFMVEPALRDGAGIFRAQGRLQIWMTADERKIPVLMRSRISVGAITVSLTNIE